MCFIQDRTTQIFLFIYIVILSLHGCERVLVFIFDQHLSKNFVDQFGFKSGCGFTDFFDVFETFLLAFFMFLTFYQVHQFAEVLAVDVDLIISK